MSYSYQMTKTYDVCFGGSLAELNQRVDENIAYGWRCQGGVAVTHIAYKNEMGGIEYQPTFYQAMVAAFLISTDRMKRN